MAIVFPASPSVNDTFTVGSITYQCVQNNPTKWIGLGVTPADRLVEGSNSLEINASNQLVWSGGDVNLAGNLLYVDDANNSIGVNTNLPVNGDLFGSPAFTISGTEPRLNLQQDQDLDANGTISTLVFTARDPRTTSSQNGREMAMIRALWIGSGQDQLNTDLSFYVANAGTGASANERMRLHHNGSLKLGQNLTDEAGPLCIDITNAQGAGAGAACGIFLRNTQATNNNAVSIFGGADDYSNAASAINFINSNHANNYGDISFDTRGISLYGTGYTERMRLYSSGALRVANTYVTDVGTTGIDNCHAYFDAYPSLKTWGSTGNKDVYFEPSLVVRTPVRDTVNNPAIVIAENGGQATGRNSLVFFNGDYNTNVGFIKARLYTQVGANYADPSFYIDVADGSKVMQNRFSINSNGTFSGSSTNNISDARLKENIQTIENPIEKIKGLTGRTFTWTDASTRNDGKVHYGFIAQEVDTVVSDLVNHDSGLTWFDADDNIVEEFDENVANSSKTVHEQGVIPILVEALKEALDKIDALEARLEAGGL